MILNPLTVMSRAILTPRGTMCLAPNRLRSLKHNDLRQETPPLTCRAGVEEELGQEKDAALRLLPRVHRVASLLKRWLLGTHQGAVSPKHLDYYLDEFTFRFNRRKSRSRGKLFYRLVQQAAQVEPTPYRDLVGGKDAIVEDHKM